MQNASQFKLAKLIIKTLFLVLTLGIILAIYGFMQYNNRNIDFVTQDKDWQYFPGAVVTEKVIHFSPLNRIIVHQDGSWGQPNPPVNIGGQHLHVKGDFKITAIALEIYQQASFRLYASPPIVYDQWRYESPSVEVMVDTVKNLTTVRIWDGSSSHSMDTRTYATPFKLKTVISLEHIGGQINIIVNNQILGSMPDHHIFDSGNIWFGADGKAGSNGWTLKELYAEALGTGRIEIIPPPSLIVDQSDQNSLGNLANKHSKKLKIGAAISVGPLLTDEKYGALAIGQFNMLTPENSMKPQFIHPEANIYSFEQADQLVDIALKNNMTVHGHALVYDKSSPEWMTKSPVADRQKIMVDHINTVVGHFKGRVAEWDVVNEPFSKKHALYKNGKTGLEPNIWFEAMGEEYIDLAFRAAHEADPGAKLYLNDYGVEKDGQHWDALLALVKRLKQRGVPIDGVGFEAHVYTDGDYFDASQLKQHMENLNRIGLLARISEIDVTGDDPKQQINQYVMALDVCLRTPNCTSYSTWGITDKYGSTTRSDRYPLVYGTSLLWDKNMKAKPAYGALQERLRQP